jgi:hypothetical protein
LLCFLNMDINVCYKVQVNNFIMPFQLLSIYQTIHKQFILKPNPYVTKEEAQSAYFKYTGFSWFAVSTAGNSSIYCSHFGNECHASTSKTDTAQSIL